VTPGGIYIASKAKHGPRWRALRAGGARIVSTWIDESGPGETADFADLWLRNVTEAVWADVLIAYREPGETMKGALVEIGAHLARGGARVFWVGEEDGYTVFRHPCVRAFSSFDEALTAAQKIVSAADAHRAFGARFLTLEEARYYGVEGLRAAAVAPPEVP
jgi:hypothetical protein